MPIQEFTNLLRRYSLNELNSAELTQLEYACEDPSLQHIFLDYLRSGKVYLTR